MRQALLATAIGGAIVCAHSQVFAADAGVCDDLPKSRLEVLQVYGDTSKKAVVGIRELQAVAQDNRPLAEALAKHPLYIAPPQLVWSASVDHRAIRRGEVFCPAPAKVTIHVGFKPREAVMAREAAAIPCLRNALVSHHAKHIEAADAALQTLLPLTEATVADALKTAKAVRHRSESQAKAAFERSIGDVMDRVVRSLGEEVRAVEDTIDRPEELEALKSCSRPRPAADKQTL